MSTPATSKAKIEDPSSLAAALRGGASEWAVKLHLGTAAALTATREQWESHVVAPLLFAWEVAKTALEAEVRPRSLTFVVNTETWTGLAEVALATIRCFCRSLAVEAAPETVVCGISGSEPDAADLLLTAAPSGAWVDLREQAPTALAGAPPIEPPVVTEHQVAVVTGGGNGIGKAVAARLVENGAAVVVVDLNDAAARDVAHMLAGRGGRADAVVGDVGELATLNMALAAASRWGRVTAWINNAGICYRCAIRGLSSEAWRSTLAVNLEPALRSTQLLAKAGGPISIVNISSAAARSAGLIAPGRYNAYAAYAASKAGLDALTRVLAREVASQGIRVNAVAPGPVLTDLVSRLYSPEERHSLEKQVPLGRFADPQEIAEAVGYLVSPSSDYITGHVLSVDGGLATRWSR